MGRMMRQNLEGEDFHCRDFQGRNGGTEKRSDWSKVAHLLSNREENNASNSPAPISTFNTPFWAPGSKWSPLGKSGKEGHGFLI